MLLGLIYKPWIKKEKSDQAVWKRGRDVLPKTTVVITFTLGETLLVNERTELDFLSPSTLNLSSFNLYK